MASGYVAPHKEADTWLHRPSCKREESPCQRGAVHTWHLPDQRPRLTLVRYKGETGHRPTDRPGPNLTRSRRWVRPVLSGTD